MPINRQREKLADAVLFFRENTNNLGITKLFKLLFLLDFSHYARTGRSVTGLRYETWDKGPAPAALWAEIKGGLREDLASAFAFNNVGLDEGRTMSRIDAKRRYEGKHLSKVEKELLAKLAEIFKEATAAQMVDVTHAPGAPWVRTTKSRGMNAEIDYALALDGTTKDQLTPDGLKAILDDLATSEPAP